MSNKKWIWVGIISVIVLIGGCNGCGTYSSLVNMEEDCNGKWAQVQNVYQRRADLAQQVVDIVSRSANFEKSTLTEVIAARQQVTNINVDPSDPNSFKQFEAAQGQLQGALSRLMVVVEKYPDLKTTGQFATFQSQMEGSENRITTERKTYTDYVQSYNKFRRQPVFPILMSSMFGFEARPYFEASQAAQSSPDINGRFQLNEKTLNQTNR
jgi:LemA protein